MAELSNCPRCDALFVKSLNNVCQKCYREVEEMFETVYTYIRKKENRKASLQEVHVATGVDEEQIVRFIKEGRLHLAQFPNLTYPCEKCSNPIREGRICNPCLTGIQSDLKQAESEKQLADRREKESRKVTYHSVDFRD
ncbi:TIGR03826 family flagellar region protein [Alteribacter populi]|uniref:TIGR03826 family flagellar region protein n=1 Tax=Alteribacter populi TaxID=2011011 RepID=UPI000BBA59F3|nr:TIGR03826 family flagellar region protein [Alteribacter populi]